MNLFTFTVASLAIWRLSYILVHENGPLMVFARLRAFLGRTQRRSGGLFDMISCVRCISVIIGLIGALSVSSSFLEWLGYGLGFSAVASLLDLLLSKKPNSLPVVTRPATDDKVLVRGSTAPEQRNNVVRHPHSTYGSVAVKTQASLDS